MQSYNSMNLSQIILFVKKSSTQLFFGLGLVIFTFQVIYNNESLLMKAKRIDFPGITELTLNKSFQRYKLKKNDVELSQELTKNLKSKNLKLVSSVFNDNNKNIQIAVTQSDDDQLLLTTIKNNQIFHVHRINNIENKKITLQYGTIQLNSNKLASLPESAEML